MKYFLIEEDHLVWLRYWSKRFHTETRLNGDEMRDAGHTLAQIVKISELLEVPESELTSKK